jgi:hypothetical protein
VNRRPNRIILSAIGVLLIVAGAAALLAAQGVLDVEQPAELHDRLSASAATYSREWKAGVLVGGLLVAAIGAWLVRRQVTAGGGDRLGTLMLHRGDRGRTTLEATAVAGAAAKDLRGLRGVVDSAVRMVSFDTRPRVRVWLAVSAHTEPRAVLDRAEDVYQRISRMLGTEAVHVDTTVRPTGEPPARVE